MENEKFTLPKTARGIARRQAILESAETLFREKGYVNTTINEIVRTAGGSLASAYKWFPGKEHLFMAVFEQKLQEVRTFICAATLTGATLEETVWNLFHAVYHISVEGKIRFFLFDGIHIPEFRQNALEVFQKNLIRPIEDRLTELETRFHFRYRLGAGLTSLLLIRQIRGTALEFVLDATDLEARKRLATEQTQALFLALIERPRTDDCCTNPECYPDSK